MQKIAIVTRLSKYSQRFIINNDRFSFFSPTLDEKRNPHRAFFVKEIQICCSRQATTQGREILYNET